jgi:hypothetical protein
LTRVGKDGHTEIYFTHYDSATGAVWELSLGIELYLRLVHESNELATLRVKILDSATRAMIRPPLRLKAQAASG